MGEILRWRQSFISVDFLNNGGYFSAILEGLGDLFIDMIERVAYLFEVLLVDGVQLEEPFGSFTNLELIIQSAFY